MNDKTVVLNKKQWMNCWKDMCDTFGYVPSWDEYMRHFQYFGCVNYVSTDDEGLEIIFKTKKEAADFKAKWI